MKAQRLRADPGGELEAMGCLYRRSRELGQTVVACATRSPQNSAGSSKVSTDALADLILVGHEQDVDVVLDGFSLFPKDSPKHSPLPDIGSTV